MNSGILYLLYDWKESPYNQEVFHAMLNISIASMRLQGYDGPISIATNNNSLIFESTNTILIPHDILKEVEQYNAPHYYIKTMMNLLTPFDRTIFMDCDVEAVKPFDNLWSCQGFCMPEMGVLDMSLDIMRAFTFSDEEAKYNYDILPHKNYRYYSTGVMIWDDNNHPLWGLAKEEYLKFPGADELAFTRAMFFNHIYPTPMPVRYNSLENFDDTVFVHYGGMKRKLRRLDVGNKISIKIDGE